MLLHNLGHVFHVVFDLVWCSKVKSLDLLFFLLSIFVCWDLTFASPPPFLPDLPTMEKPRSHTSSQAQWKISDTLHYVVLVPIKADTICCQEHGDTLQKGNPPRLHPLPMGFKCFWMYIIILLQGDLYCQVAVQTLHLQSPTVGNCLLCVSLRNSFFEAIRISQKQIATRR